MRILEVCPYSAGICGVWSRVSEEASRLSKLGNEVKVFSSNKTKGTDLIVKERDMYSLLFHQAPIPIMPFYCPCISQYFRTLKYIYFVVEILRQIYK